MSKLTKEAVVALSELSMMTTEQFLGSIMAQWDRIGDMSVELIANAGVDGVDPEHEDIVKDMLRVGVRCMAMKKLMALVMAEPKLCNVFEPSDTDLDMQLAKLRANVVRLHEQEC